MSDQDFMRRKFESEVKERLEKVDRECARQGYVGMVNIPIYLVDERGNKTGVMTYQTYSCDKKGDTDAVERSFDKYMKQNFGTKNRKSKRTKKSKKSKKSKKTKRLKTKYRQSRH